MKVLIAEDEPLAAERLSSLLHECHEAVTITDCVDSVEGLAGHFNSGQNPDLLLLDIELSDGKSFEAFNKATINTPVIFTTAYDQYALQAFRHFGIDYLLKPIQKTELQKALDKFQKMTNPGQALSREEVSVLRQWVQKNSKSYRERFLIKAGNKLQFKTSGDVAYFYADGKSAYLVSYKENRKYLIDHTLEELEGVLDPSSFFRISRKFIVHVQAIAEVKGLISSRVEVKLSQPVEHELSVSRDRVAAFKNWLNQ
ncbi:MAG: LytTR family DNA-binding domain-containing protein [Cyclobacteriaceae bacterium]|jgi:DNA-binding LytR/AlgR family response regulator|nr:LytTR family DNA-binding domain-containing protein [Cyclobacteriaceae bacterium]